MKKQWVLAALIFFLSNNSFSQTITLGNLQYEKKDSKIKMVSDFENSLIKKLEENKAILNERVTENTDYIRHIDTYKAENRKLSDIKNEIMLRSSANAAGEALRKTPLGIRAEIIAKNISSYFRIKYKKLRGEKPVIILPGIIDKENVDSDYEILLSTSLYEGPNSLGQDFSIGFKGKYGGIETEILYKPIYNEKKINLTYKKFLSFWMEKGEYTKAGFLFKIEY